MYFHSLFSPEHPEFGSVASPAMQRFTLGELFNALGETLDLANGHEFAFGQPDAEPGVLRVRSGGVYRDKTTQDGVLVSVSLDGEPFVHHINRAGVPLLVEPCLLMSTARCTSGLTEAALLASLNLGPAASRADLLQGLARIADAGGGEGELILSRNAAVRFKPSSWPVAGERREGIALCLAIDGCCASEQFLSDRGVNSLAYNGLHVAPSDVLMTLAGVLLRQHVRSA